MKKRALITGVTGQDGSYLAEFLLGKGYEVHGIKRRSSSFNTGRVDHLFEAQRETANPSFFLHFGDLTDATNLIRVVQEIQPDEIYNLAAQSHVAVSFETPEYTAQSDALGPLRLLDAIRILGLEKKTKFYQASTSELFGNAPAPQDENTPFQPRSPYAAAKLYAYAITINYREAYGMFACNGILFNHESSRRGETFVTRKITRAVARIAHGLQDVLYLGNLNAKRDWGHAQEYVQAMWHMMQQEIPLDLVIGTGTAHTVRQFVEKAFAHVGTTVTWHGSGIHEYGVDNKTGKTVVAVDPRYFRPTEVHHLCADPSQARAILGWKPHISFEELVSSMLEADMNKIAQAYPTAQDAQPPERNHSSSGKHTNRAQL